MVDDLRFEVAEMKDRRIASVLVRRIEQPLGQLRAQPRERARARRARG